MEIIGKIILALPEATGTSKAGNQWHKREYVLETQESYPKKIFFDFFGDRADQYPLQVGQMIRLYFDIESREYQNRWFTSIRGIRAEDANVQPVQNAPAQYAATQPTAAPFPGSQSAPAQYGAMPGSVPPPPMPGAEPSDDLPF